MTLPTACGNVLNCKGTAMQGYPFCGGDRCLKDAPNRIQSLAEEALRLAELATPGPWQTDQDSRSWDTPESASFRPCVIRAEQYTTSTLAKTLRGPRSGSDADLIVFARTALPLFARHILGRPE